MWFGEASPETFNVSAITAASHIPNSSKPARISPIAKSHPRRAEFFALPNHVLVHHVPGAVGILKVQTQLICFYAAERLCVQLHMVLV
jgi:hypothetical protein